MSASDVITPRRVELDIRDALAKIFGLRPKLIKDLLTNEAICTVCDGLGIMAFDKTYGLRGDARLGFPYTQEGLAPCSACYYGVQTLCEHCGWVIPKHGGACNCEKSQAAARESAQEVERVRRLNCKRVALAEYDGEMLYDDDTGTYEPVDSDDLEPSHTYLGCVLRAVKVRPSADAVIDRMEDSAPQIDDDSEPFAVSKDGPAKLQKRLDEWVAECVTFADVYWPDYGVIVKLPQEEG